MKFNATEYYDASRLRYDDLKHLQINQNTIIFSLYCAGVAVECMLRAYIVKNSGQFDSKHNLEKLYIDSQLADFLDNEDKRDISSAIKKINKLWRNDFRYLSERKLKELIIDEIINSKQVKFKSGRNVLIEFNKEDINTGIHKYIKEYYPDFFDATKLILETGENKWTY